MKDFLRAISFLTILPMGKGLPSGDKELARSMAFFPLAGLAIGLLLAIGFSLFSLILPKSFTLWLTLGLLGFLTGCLHLDGFADTMDGLACGGTRERMLEVMRDSRIGAFGVISLIFLIGAKYLALDQIQNSSIPYSLIAMAVMGRSSMVWVCYRSPYARSDEGLGRPFTKNLTRREIAIASVSALGIALFLLGAKGALVFLASAIFSFGHRLFFLKKLGGVTGDVLGSANELTELLSILLLVILERF